MFYIFTNFGGIIKMDGKTLRLYAPRETYVTDYSSLDKVVEYAQNKWGFKQVSDVDFMQVVKLLSELPYDDEVGVIIEPVFTIGQDGKVRHTIYNIYNCNMSKETLTLLADGMSPQDLKNYELLTTGYVGRSLTDFGSQATPSRVEVPLNIDHLLDAYANPEWLLTNKEN
jgi:hypothetical protein